MKTIPLLIPWISIWLAVASCGEPGPIRIARFAADPAPTGARMWLEVTTAGDVAAVSTWAAGLGLVFGYSVHLRFDTFDLGPADESTAFLNEGALDNGGDGRAYHLARMGPGDVFFGGTRAEPAAGPVDLDDDTLLHTCKLTAYRAGRLPLALTRVVVRRADGTWVPVATSGGELVARGGES